MKSKNARPNGASSQKYDAQMQNEPFNWFLGRNLYSNEDGTVQSNVFGRILSPTVDTFLNLYAYNGSVDSSNDCVDSNLNWFYALPIGVCIQKYSWNDTEPTALLSYEYSYVYGTDSTNIEWTYTEYSSFDCTGAVQSTSTTVSPTTCK